MKNRVSLYVLFIIIITELIGLSVILYLGYTLDRQSFLFNSLTDEVIEVEDDVEQIRGLLYKYEYHMVGELYSDKMTELESMDFKETEILLRRQLGIHGMLMQRLSYDTERAALFRNVNDDVLNYLNYNAALLAMKESAEAVDTQKFTDTHIIPLMKRVNLSIDALSYLSEYAVSQSKLNLKGHLLRSRTVCLIATVLMVFSIIVSIYHSYKALTGLETRNSFLKFKSEVNEILMSNMQHNIIMGIVDLIESRSGETGQHVKRTSHLVNLILLRAKERGAWPDVLTDEYIDFVTRAAPLHDIGKIVVSDTILNKPGKLTDEEYAVMKTHAEAGAKIVYNILGGGLESVEYIDIAAAIAHFHHERWDGTGYPTGRKGEEIPLCARVMAVADVFDALVSERCYKKAMPYEAAFAIIKAEAGRHFDPQVVALFLEMKDEITEEN